MTIEDTTSLPEELYAAGGWRFDAEGEPALICEVPPDHKLIALAKHSLPMLMTLDGPGIYEIDCPLATDNMVFPILLICVADRHAQAFLNMSVEKATEMCAMAEKPEVTLH